MTEFESAMMLIGIMSCTRVVLDTDIISLLTNSTSTSQKSKVTVPLPRTI